MAEEDIGDFETRSLVRRAHLLNVPIPPRDQRGMWEQDMAGRWYLSDGGIYQVRTLTRGEEKERREAKLVWVAPLTGLLGAAAGLTALIGTYII